MPSIIVRNWSDQVHRALRLRAAMHGRSTAAEVRDILTSAALPQDRLQIGTELRKFRPSTTFPSWTSGATLQRLNRLSLNDHS